MALLQKMGWRPGEGLGKNKEGTLVPLQLEIKMDKKGEHLGLLKQSLICHILWSYKPDMVISKTGYGQCIALNKSLIQAHLLMNMLPYTACKFSVIRQSTPSYTVPARSFCMLLCWQA
jgi:hypothetical protein